MRVTVTQSPRVWGWLCEGHGGPVSTCTRVAVWFFRTQLQRIAALDSSWAHLGNGLNAHNNPSWLGLYLAVCRLLDLCLVMPADAVPHFQL